MDVNEALEAYKRFRIEALARSPLKDMAEWVASGRIPPAASLRAQGLVEHSMDRDLAFTLRLARKPFIEVWGYSIPCAEAVGALRDIGPLVEVGAGSGYWTALLQAAGLDVIGTDINANGDIGYGFQAGRHAPILPMDASEAIERHPGRGVFCSWPTEGDGWALDAGQRLASGCYFAVIGGRTTGTTELWSYLTTRFEQSSDVEIPQFPGCDDRLKIYRKR